MSRNVVLRCSPDYVESRCIRLVVSMRAALHELKQTNTIILHEYETGSNRQKNCFSSSTSLLLRVVVCRLFVYGGNLGRVRKRKIHL